MDLILRATDPVKVTGEGFDERVVQAGETVTITGKSFSVSAASAEDILPPPATQEVFDPGNRPNGTMTAGIAPKMPKSSGELVQEPAEGGVIERPAEGGVYGQSTQGGGPQAEPGFKTPGPQPEPGGTGALAQTAAATGDVNPKGQPVARTQENVQKAPAQRK